MKPGPTGQSNSGVLQRTRLFHRLDQHAVHNRADHARPVVVTNADDLPSEAVNTAIPRIALPPFLDEDRWVERRDQVCYAATSKLTVATTLCSTWFRTLTVAVQDAAVPAGHVQDAFGH